VDPGFRFCPDCGQALASEAPAAPASSVPEDLAQKIRAAHSLPGERKQVTVLFCDLAGSTAVAGGLDPEVYREVLDQYVALAMHEVYRFEGIVNQLSGDGFMALFGAPVAHEDAPQRAVLAALAIRDALKIPVKFVGLGETPEDIETFDPARFVDALFLDRDNTPAR
jgi:class 3 adenylate cyclase